MQSMIQPVPRSEIERLFPELSGARGDRPFWDGEACSMSEAKLMHYVVYGPLDPQALVQASKIFKSVKVVSRG